MSNIESDADSTQPSGGRRVSPDSITQGSGSGTVQLTSLSVRAIGLYQKQAELTDRLWSYFGVNSLFAVLVALVAPVLANMNLLPRTGWFVLTLFMLVIVAYWAFSTGNRFALRVSQEALERIAAQAQMASGIELQVIKPVKAVLFHKVVSLVIVSIMFVGFYVALAA